MELRIKALDRMETKRLEDELQQEAKIRQDAKIRRTEVNTTEEGEGSGMGTLEEE